MRQQSKEIAENLRNKVKKEKEKQISQIEKDGAAKLKQWQNKKLMQLQNQYRDCLDIIGVGHSQAEVEKQAEQEYLANQSLNKDIAEERGLKAAQKLNIEREERNQKDDVAKQRKLYSRDVENARSAMVTKLNKKKKSPFKKKKIKKKSIDIDVDHSDSDLDSDLPIFLDLSSRSSASSTTSTQRGIINTNPSIATTTSTTTVTTTTSNMNYFTSDRVRKQNVQSSAKGKIQFKYFYFQIISVNINHVIICTTIMFMCKDIIILEISEKKNFISFFKLKIKSDLRKIMI